VTELAVICWNTIYTQAAVEHVTSGGAQVRDEHPRSALMSDHDHINFGGRYNSPTAPDPSAANYDPSAPSETVAFRRFDAETPTRRLPARRRPRGAQLLQR